MKAQTFLAAALLLCATGAEAASVPLAGSYGDEKGCAAHSGAQVSGGGTATLISADDIRFDGSVCPYTGVTEAAAGAEEKAWTIKLACESGHDEVVRGTLLLTEKPESKSLSVALVDGAGPKGDFQACDSDDSAKP